jgi:hypothetical protein
VLKKDAPIAMLVKNAFFILNYWALLHEHVTVTDGYYRSGHSIETIITQAVLLSARIHGCGVS